MAKGSVTAHKNGQCHHYGCVGKLVRHQGKVAACTSCNKFAYNVSPGHRRKKTCKHGIYLSVCTLGCKK
jgi:hypothetical protein